MNIRRPNWQWLNSRFVMVSWSVSTLSFVLVSVPIDWFLTDGIFMEFMESFFLDFLDFWTDKPALGYAFTAKSHSESTHRLPTPPDAYGEKNLGRIWCEIEKFMDTDDKAYDGGKPMVFSFADPYASEVNQIEVLKSFVKQFVGNSQTKLPIDLYPLTRLFYTLRKELHARGRADMFVPNEKYCEGFLAKDPYETRSGISCQVILITIFNFLFSTFLH